MSLTDLTLEACVDSVLNAIYAQSHGAHRIELCAHLHLDGTTPERTLIRDALRAVHLPVKVMIRPRGGDFVYSRAEFEEMRAAIRMCHTLGVREIATGVLNPDRTLDTERINLLAEDAGPMSVTIHKCIDLVPDVLEAIARLKKIPGVSAILSSGQAATAMEGTSMLQEMLHACGEDLTLIVAGKVTRENLEALHLAIGAREYHGRMIV